MQKLKHWLDLSDTMDAYLDDFITDMMDRQVYRNGINEQFVGLFRSWAILCIGVALLIGVYFI